MRKVLLSVSILVVVMTLSSNDTALATHTVYLAEDWDLLWDLLEEATTPRGTFNSL